MNAKISICHAVVRFDNVPSGVESEVLERTRLPLYGDVLSYEYLFRRKKTMEGFQRILAKDLGDWLGDETSRLLRCGIFPTLYIDFALSGMAFFRMEVKAVSLHKLALQNVGLELSLFDVCKSSVVMRLSPDLIKLIAKYKFSLEIV